MAGRAVRGCTARQGNMVRGEVRSTPERRCRRMAVRALTRHRVLRAGGCLGGPGHDGRRTDEALAGLMTGRAGHGTHCGVNHRRRGRTARIAEDERRETARRVAALARGRAERNVIDGRCDDWRRAGEAQAARVTGGAGDPWHRRVIHRRTLVRHLERREIRCRVAGLAGCIAGRNVIGRRNP